jgi:hypothetical protein
MGESKLKKSRHAGVFQGARRKARTIEAYEITAADDGEHVLIALALEGGEAVSFALPTDRALTAFNPMLGQETAKAWAIIEGILDETEPTKPAKKGLGAKVRGIFGGKP